jgi:hypothetical protein
MLASVCVHATSVPAQSALAESTASLVADAAVIRRYGPADKALRQR